MMQHDPWSFVCRCGWKVGDSRESLARTYFRQVAEALTRAHLQGHEAGAGVPVGRETKSWAVTIERNGEQVVTISSHMLSGRDLSEEDEAVIRLAAEHLRAFIGAPPAGDALLEDANDFTEAQINELRAEFEDWLSARQVPESVRRMLLPWKREDAPREGNGAAPHFWTVDPADKNRCAVCGDGPWGRHRFQEQPTGGDAPRSREHTCHLMNPPFPYECQACVEERIDAALEPHLWAAALPEQRVVPERQVSRPEEESSRAEGHPSAAIGADRPMSKKDYESTVMRMAGNIAAGAYTAQALNAIGSNGMEAYVDDRIVRGIVVLARAIVAEVQRTAEKPE